MIIVFTKYHSGDEKQEEFDGQRMLHVWGTGDAYRVLVVRPEGRRPLGIPRCRWEYNIKIDLKEIGRGRRVG
jgi:hypothetical protein